MPIPSGVRGHHSVLDAVMDHFNEMPGTARFTMEVPLFRCTTKFLATNGTGNVASARRERGKDRIESLNYFGFAADHHAITAMPEKSERWRWRPRFKSPDGRTKT
jgi:hypothetical protein